MGQRGGGGVVLLGRALWSSSASRFGSGERLLNLRLHTFPSRLSLNPQASILKLKRRNADAIIFFIFFLIEEQ